MIRWPWRRLPKPDIEAFLAELAASHPGKGYSKMDRYRDFKRLFGSEDGRRVLHELFSWGNMFRPVAPMSKFDPYETAFHDGERNIVLKLLAVMNAEPSVRPASSKGNNEKRPQ